jgi:GntR family transcriptional regulator/MocR family aminotransferase
VFEQLLAEGYIAARQGSGYFVPARLAEPTNPMTHRAAAGAPRMLSRQTELLRLQPGVPRQQRPFELGQCEIDGRLMASWKRLAARALSGRSRLEWSYGDPQGEHVLRAAIAEYLGAARGVRCRPEQIVLTAGTQQGLSLTARILLDPGATALVEDPCYRAALDILHAAEGQIVPVAVDEQGLDIDAAPRLGAPPRLVYTTPSRQYPLGMAMPLARRLALLAWAEREGVWIIEDDYESEFQRPGHMLPSLQGLDRAGRVIYLGTFSKLLFPSLRLGYAVLPEDLVAPFTAARQLTDRQSSGLIQAIMTEFMLEGHFARHLKRMRTLYAERQAYLTGLLTRRFGSLVETTPNESGMYLVAWLPPGWNDRPLAARLDVAGVTAAPLSALTLATKRRPALVLGYTGHSEAAMARAVERMAEVLQPQAGPINTRKAELRSDQTAR